MAASTDTRQFDPTYHMDYDYDDCAMWRRMTKPISWRKLGARYRRHHSTVNERYNTDTDRHKSIRSNKRRAGNNGGQRHRTVQKNRSSNADNAKDDKLEYHQNLTLDEIRRTPYGKLEPTMLISKLDHPTWLRYYGGEYRYRYNLEPLNILCDLLYEGDKEAALYPRFGGKTVTYLGITPREIAEIRQPHLTICSPKRPKVLFRGVASFMMGYRSAQFRKDYGDIIELVEGRVQANRTDLTISLHEEFNYPHTDPVYRASSREGDIIGWHGAHIHFEDPSQQENAAGTKKLIEWYGEVVEPMMSLDQTVTSRLTATTTRKGRKDFANFLFDDGWQETRYAAIEVLSGRLPVYSDIVWKTQQTRSGQTIKVIDYIEKTGEFKLFNPAWNLQRLLEIAIRKYSSFMSQYQNTPISIESDFLEPMETIDPFEIVPEHHKLMMVIDPAFGKSAAASETAIIIGFRWNFVLYLVDVVIDRLYGTKLIKKCYDLYNKWNPKRTKIEDDFKQITTRQHIHANLRRIPGFSTFENRGFGDKHARVQMLEEPLVMRRIRAFNTATDLYKLEDQIESYSEEVDIKYGYDGADCLASIDRLTSKRKGFVLDTWN